MEEKQKQWLKVENLRREQEEADQRVKMLQIKKNEDMLAKKEKDQMKAEMRKQRADLKNMEK